MPPPITDAVLGSRFWLVNDFSPLENVQNNVNAPAPEHAPANVKHDAAVFSFVADAGDEMVRSAINRAEMFAAQHTLTDNDRLIAEGQVNGVSGVLLRGNDKADLINRAIQLFGARGLDGDGATLCRRAFAKLMQTREFVSRAELGEPLGADGKRALLNAVLGLAKMLGSGSISDSAVVELANGSFYDASKKTDLLRLAADSAKKVCDKFIGEARFDAVIASCREALNGANGLSQERRAEIEGMIQNLRAAKFNAVLERKAAVGFIKCDYLFTDPTGAVTSDSDFQSRQLDKIRDSLRAFRYSIDKCQGRHMPRMERMRRFFDNMRSQFGGRMITAEGYRALQNRDTAFNNLARSILNAINPGQDNAGGFAPVSLDESAADATRLSHMTNDRIRYHYSGIEQKQKESIAAFRKELDDAVGPGGSRTVTFSIGADALIGIDVEWAKLQAKIGGSAEFTAKINVSNKDGLVEVTFIKGGEGHAGADAKIGSDPDAKDDEPKVAGIGVKASASAGVSHSRSVTKTYASLDEFARTVGAHSRLVNHRVREYIYTLGKDVVQGIGRGVMLGLAGLGFRIRRSNMDQVAYAAQLRKRDVFGPMSGILLPRRNTEIIAKKTASTTGVSVRAEGEAGVYFNGGDGDLATDRKFGGGVQYSYSRTKTLESKAYVSFAKSLAGYSMNYLETRFNAELGRYDGNDQAVRNWINSLRDQVHGAQTASEAARMISQISELMDGLEADAATHGQDEREYWVVFAKRTRMLAAAAACLAKRAETDPANAAVAKSAREYLLPRLANPAVQMPEDVFLEEMHNSFDMGRPIRSRHVTRLTFTFDAFQSKSEGLLESGANWAGSKIGDGLGIGGAISSVAGSAPGGAVLESLNGDVADFGREMAGLNGKAELLLIKDNNLSTVQDKRPWMNGNIFTVEARIPDALPLRLLIELIVRAVVKNKAGTDDIGESQLASEIKDAFLDTFKTTGEKAAVEGAEKLLETGIGELAKKSTAFASLVGKIAGLGANYDSTDDTFKTMRFNFVNGRFDSFVLAEDYEYKASFSVKPVPFLSLKLGMASNTVTNDYMVYTKPTVVSMLSVADNYNLAGNQEAFKNFLFRNRKGVMRLMRTISANSPAEVPGDKRWSEDRNLFQNLTESLRNLMINVSTRNDALGQEARLLWPKLQTAIDDARNANPDANATVLVPLAQRLFSTMAKAYSLVAKAD